MYCIQTAKDIVKLLTRHGSPIVLVFFDPERRCPIPRGIPSAGSGNYDYHVVHQRKDTHARAESSVPAKVERRVEGGVVGSISTDDSRVMGRRHGLLQPLAMAKAVQHRFNGQPCSIISPAMHIESLQVAADYRNKKLS